jgi:hypothetical protein
LALNGRDGGSAGWRATFATTSSIRRGDGGLVARGDELVSARDIVSARLYYQRAAALGDGRGRCE